MTTIYTFAQSAIEEARSAGRYGTANLYSGAINSFRNFTGDIPLTFKEVTAGMIKRYEESLLQKGRRHNTISAYMRMLRSIFNQAYQQGIPDTIPADELFRFVFTGYEPTAKRAISPALIRRLSQLNLEHSPHLRFSRDLFLLSFYLRGIPFVDLVHLRKTDMHQVDKRNASQVEAERHSVCRPGSSPQNGHEAQHHLLLPPQDPPAAIGLPRTVRRRDSATLHRQALPLSLPSAHTLSGRSGRLPAVQKRSASLQPAPAPAIQDAAPECAAHLLRGTPQLGHHRQRRRSSHRHDKRRTGTQFRKGNTRIPLFF